jgi:hypothetical protein
MPTLWRIPPEYLPMGRLRTSFRLTSSSSSSIRGRAERAESPFTAAR